MKAESFKEDQREQLVQTIDGFLAFVPRKLPPKFVWDDATVLALSRADAALSHLAGVGHNLPNPHLFIQPLIRREAVLSSQIEGTQTTFEQLLEIEAGDGQVVLKGRERDDLREVNNYVRAMEHGLKRLEEIPLSLRLVRELHAILMEGVRGERATPGELRRRQNWIGPEGSTPATARFVPPPPDALDESLGDWERYLHLRGHSADLVQCAVMHQQFEAIHPFLDGNGRVGRLLITLFLVERRRLGAPLLYLSDFIERHRRDYYELLLRVSTDGDWGSWLRFFLAGVEETASDAARRALQLLALREQLRKECQGAAIFADALIDRLFQNPFVSAAQAAEALAVSKPTATRTLQKMEALGQLRETTGRNWGRLWCAGGVLEALRSPAESRPEN